MEAKEFERNAAAPSVAWRRLGNVPGEIAFVIERKHGRKNGHAISHNEIASRSM